MKVSARFLLPVLLLTLTAACNQTRASSDNPTPQESVPSAQLTQNPTQPKPKNTVRTEALSPTPIRINLKNLPAPFATESASKRLKLCLFRKIRCCAYQEALQLMYLPKI